MLPENSLEHKPNVPDLAAILVFHSTVGSIILPSILSINGCLHQKNGFDERKQDCLVQKFGLRLRLCSQGAALSAVSTMLPIQNDLKI